jgi:hypothetical protein
MKKLLITLLTIFSLSCFGQDALLKVSPFHLIDGTFYSSYERIVGNDRSLYLAGGYRLSDNGDDKGWMGELQIRKYLFRLKSASTNQSLLSGFYSGLYGNGKYFSEYDKYDSFTEDFEIKQIEGGVIMGLQLVFHKKLSVDFFLGGGLRVSEITGDREYDELFSPRGYTGIVPKIGFEVGVAF